MCLKVGRMDQPTTVYTKAHESDSKQIVVSDMAVEKKVATYSYLVCSFLAFNRALSFSVVISSAFFLNTNSSIDRFLYIPIVKLYIYML